MEIEDYSSSDVDDSEAVLAYSLNSWWKKSATSIHSNTALPLQVPVSECSDRSSWMITPSVSFQLKVINPPETEILCQMCNTMH